MSDDRRERCPECGLDLNDLWHVTACQGQKPPAPQAEPKAEDGLHHD